MVETEGLCPAISTEINSEPHGVVIDQYIGLDENQNRYYNCKNTHTNKTSVKVGYSSDPDVYPLYEAILIRFERK